MKKTLAFLLIVVSFVSVMPASASQGDPGYDPRYEYFVGWIIVDIDAENNTIQIWACYVVPECPNRTLTVAEGVRIRFASEPGVWDLGDLAVWQIADVWLDSRSQLEAISKTVSKQNDNAPKLHETEVVL